MGGVAYVLWRLRNRLTGGLLFALYLVLAGLERFLVEFIRRNEDVALGLTQAQLISVVDDRRRRPSGSPSACGGPHAPPRPRPAALRPTAAGRRRAGSPSRSGTPARSEQMKATRSPYSSGVPSRPAGTLSRAWLSAASIEPCSEPSRVRREQPGRDRVDRDPVARDLARERLEQSHRRHPVRVRERQPRDRLVDRGRGDVHDPAPAALAHPGNHGLGQHPRRLHQRGVGGLPLLGVVRRGRRPPAARRCW